MGKTETGLVVPLRLLGGSGALCVYLLSALFMFFFFAPEARADEWTREALSSARRLHRRPTVPATQVPAIVRSAGYGVTVDARNRRRVAEGTWLNLKSDGSTPGLVEEDMALRERIYRALGVSTGEAEGLTPEGVAKDLGTIDKSNVLAPAVESAVEGTARKTEDEAAMRGYGITPVLNRIKDWGFSLRRVAHKRPGFADPAQFSYARNLETDADAFQVEAGLTWKKPAYWALARRGGRPSILARPTAWIAGNVTTAKPDEQNWYGGGASMEFVFALRGSACDFCCGDAKIAVNVGGDWNTSQDRDIEKVSAFADITPLVADWALGFRKPLGGPYGVHPLSYTWATNARFDYGDTKKAGTSREAADSFFRGTFSASATLYFDVLGRGIRGICADGSRDICDPDKAKKNDPALKIEYNGYWLADDEEYLDWIRASLVFPILGDEGFSIDVAYERGAQAPVSFQHAELFTVTLGVRF